MLAQNSTPLTLRASALRALSISCPIAKCSAVQALSAAESDPLGETNIEEPSLPTELPGKPDKPELVYATMVERRSVATAQGRAALIHALAHIELNAVNIALDAIWRFSGMPPQYYVQWLSVAKDEARHFCLLQNHLITLGFTYGDFTAHNGLWDMAELTKHDVLARMALVPRTLEARGLDASPQVRNKLMSAGDRKAASIVNIILHDEVGHVFIGNRWYNWLCAERNLDPVKTYAHLAQKHGAPKLIGPFNIEARRQAGFSDRELALLHEINPKTIS
jgi:uncharacterized ferritin-like protein (DUF455 family)